MKLPIMKKTAVGKREDLDCNAISQELLDSPVIVDVGRLSSSRRSVASHPSGQRPNSLAYILDLAIAHEGIEDVPLAGVASQLAFELLVLQSPVASWLKADVE